MLNSKFQEVFILNFLAHLIICKPLVQQSLNLRNKTSRLKICVSCYLIYDKEFIVEKTISSFITFIYFDEYKTKASSRCIICKLDVSKVYYMFLFKIILRYAHFNKIIATVALPFILLLFFSFSIKAFSLVCTDSLIVITISC